MKTALLAMCLLVAACKQSPPPSADMHDLAQEVHHKPELARQIIAKVLAEPHGVAIVAEELAKNETAAGDVVDELMKHPAIARAIADRCEAAKITAQVEKSK